MPEMFMELDLILKNYRCRICKVDLNLDNFGGLGENHMIYCKNCSIYFL